MLQSVKLFYNKLAAFFWTPFESQQPTNLGQYRHKYIVSMCSRSVNFGCIFGVIEIQVEVRPQIQLDDRITVSGTGEC